MTIEGGTPGLTGYGYTNEDRDGASRQSGPLGQDAEGAQRAAPLEDSAGTNGSAPTGAIAATSPGQDRAEAAEAIGLDRSDDIPGYEPSASACINRAREIARSLNHMSMSADHLMLALTMDCNARRLIERIGNVTELREAAMQRLGHYVSARDLAEQTIPPAADLADIAKAARDAANEREQSVAISDLVNAFPRSNGRLSYGATDTSRAEKLLDRIEQGLVPRVADSMSRIETVAIDAMRQSQTVQKLLQDMSSSQSYEAELRQRAFLEDIRRQVREAVDRELGAALRTISDSLADGIEELKRAARADPVAPPDPALAEAAVDAAVETAPEAEPPAEAPIEVPKPKPGSWHWLALI